jgi:predicted transcriptional regulator
MIREVISVGEQAGLAEVTTLMETKRIKRVPVLREDQLVGVRSTTRGARVSTRACPQLSQMTAATSWMAARKLRLVLS